MAGLSEGDRRDARRKQGVERENPPWQAAGGVLLRSLLRSPTVHGRRLIKLVRRWACATILFSGRTCSAADSRCDSSEDDCKAELSARRLLTLPSMFRIVCWRPPALFDVILPQVSTPTPRIELAGSQHA